MAKELISTAYFSNSAVSGYDTVAYFTQKKAIKGNNKFVSKYQGANWYFSSAENLQAFNSNPKKYAPQYGGYCSWAMAQNDKQSSDPNEWHIINGKLYLNYSAEVKRKWLKNKLEFVKSADFNWSNLN